ncbi:MAG: acyl carrier protein [Planctomycetes bacterium]|nr:acyl carrier protein [Planctomycetota bacterium]
MTDESNAVFFFLRDQVAALTGAQSERILPTSRMIDFGVDSGRALEVITAAEDAYGLEIPDRVLVDLQTLGALAHWIEARRAP